ncbi:MAG: adenylosuccinate synthase [Bdellovibrionales bacterium]|nr:adenylosuccinate synthase [Bdellovibrionales bacterium]
MANIVLVGIQWGDEGKGKIVDFLSDKADLVVRFQGGNNAGHTVIVGDQKVVLHLIPSGILRPSTTCIIGNGVVVNLDVLQTELETLESQGIKVTAEQLKISENAHLIMPYHLKIEESNEDRRGDQKVGTTKRGIGPTYVDKIAREGLRIADLKDVEYLKEKLGVLLAAKNEYIEKVLGAAPLDFEPIYQNLLKHRDWVLPHVCNASLVIHQAQRQRHNILFEGAQGTSLDVDHGTYPFVTSSNTVAGGACTGSGIGPTAINKVIGVLKAYTTRVGSGPFPTELFDEVGERIQTQGHEFGATTGRPRRCGWLDAVFLKYAVRINGLTDLSVTKLDVLTGLKEIKICTAYKHPDGSISDTFVSDGRELEKVTPVYEVHQGWDEFPSEAKNFEDLPPQAKAFLRRIEELSETQVSMVSTGPKRDEQIVVHSLF